MTPISKHLKGHKRLPAIGVGAALTLGMGWFWLSGSAAPESGKDASLLVSAITAEVRTAPRTFTYYGSVIGRKNVRVHADLSRGPITDVLAERGQHVTAGTTLAVVDDAALKNLKAQQVAARQKALAEVYQAKTRVEAAKIQQAQASAENGKSAAISDSGFFSQDALNQKAAAAGVAETNVQAEKGSLAIANANLAMATAQLTDTEARLRRTEIKAPVTGTIIESNAVVGQSGETSEPLFVILRDQDLAVEFDAPDKEASELKRGMPVAIRISGSTESIPGKIRQAAARIDPRKQAADIEVEFESPVAALPGQSARVRIDLPGKKAIYVPETALSFDSDSPSVFTIANGKALRIPVSVGERFGDRVEIVAGISPGMKIVDRFAEFLHDGEPARLAAPDNATSVPDGDPGQFSLKLSLSCPSCGKS